MAENRHRWGGSTGSGSGGSRKGGSRSRPMHMGMRKNACSWLVTITDGPTSVSGSSSSRSSGGSSSGSGGSSSGSGGGGESVLHLWVVKGLFSTPREQARMASVTKWTMVGT